MTELADPAENTFLREQDQPEPVILPRLGFVGWCRWIWRQLTSMRTALLLLLLLAVAAVPGSVFPQRRVDPGRVQQYLLDHRGSGGWLDRFGFFDVYSSPWFSAVYLLLFISLVGCVIPRSRQHLRAMRAAPPRTPRRLERLPEYARQLSVEAPGETLAVARILLRRKRYRIAEYDGGSLSAERGYLAETGNLLFHLALLALLASVAAGSFVSYAGQAIVVEGETFENTLIDYDSFTAGTGVDTGVLAPFSFTLNKLSVTFETGAGGSQFGAPRSFDGSLTVKNSPDAVSRQVDLQVNHPLDVNGVRVFLLGNGYAPVLSVTDGAGKVAYRGPVVFLPLDGNYLSNGVIKVSDAQPRQLAFAGLFLPTADPAGQPVSLFPALGNPRLVLRAYVSRPGHDDIGLDNGVPQSVYVLNDRTLTELKTAAGGRFNATMALGQTVQLPDKAGAVTFEGVKRYAALDIRYDPTKGWVLGASVLALLGVTTSLFVRRRRLWLRVSTDEQGRTVVEAAGLSRGEDARLAGEVQWLIEGATAGQRPADGERSDEGA